MKKKASLALALCFLLCACANTVLERETENTSEQSVQPVESATALPDLLTDYSYDDAEGIVITGEPLDPEELIDFAYEPKALDFYYRHSLAEFLETLDMPEIEELCARAGALLGLFSTESFVDENIFVNQPRDRARLNASTAGGEACFGEMGVRYDSFCRAYLDVFTRNAANRVFSAYPCFCSYKEQLWALGTALTGDVRILDHREFELIARTDTELFFQCTVFAIKEVNGEPPEYDPEKRDEYLQGSLDFKFIKTDEGWRVDEIPIFSTYHLNGDRVFPD